MINKISKHLNILQRRINQKAQLQEIEAQGNETLSQIKDAFLLVKKDLSTAESIIDNCEQYRKQLLVDDTIVSYEFFGSDRTAPVTEICRKAASPKVWCQFLFALTKNLNANKVLEIGTNLGVSGNYILHAQKEMKDAQLITMEGLPQLCEIASAQFLKVADKNRFEVVQGFYEDTFPQVLKKDIGYNLLFIDGNHKKDPTIEYFEKLKSKISSPAVFVFDDINWDQEMKDAWKYIKSNQDVNYSIDLYKQGLIIIDKKDPNKNIDFSLHLAF